MTRNIPAGIAAAGATMARRRFRTSASATHRGPLALTIAVALTSAIPFPAAAWEPTKPVEFVVPAGTGGGADQMARLLQGVIAKNNLMKQPMIVVNKSGGAGAEGFLAVKDAKGDPHKIIITLSNLFTTPLATGVPFNWKDMTPVAMLALDQFVLWVNAETPYKTAKEYLDAVKAAGPNKFKMGGTGSKQEDQIITVAHREGHGHQVHLHPVQGRRRRGGAARRQARRLHRQQPDRSGGAVAGRHAAAAVRVRRRADALQGEGHGRRCPGTTSRPASRPASTVDYLMLRGIFMPAGVTKEQVAFYVDLFKKVRETPEWKKFMEDGAFNTTFMTGAEYAKWVEAAEKTHVELMREAGFLAKP